MVSVCSATNVGVEVIVIVSKSVDVSIFISELGRIVICSVKSVVDDPPEPSQPHASDSDTVLVTTVVLVEMVVLGTMLVLVTIVVEGTMLVITEVEVIVVVGADHPAVTLHVDIVDCTAILK